MMRKFFAVLRKYNSAAPFSFSFEATDVGTAIDKMLKDAGVTKSTLEVDEYELLEVIDGTRYIPVAQKFKTTGGIVPYTPKPIDHRATIPSPTGEQEYTPYHKLVG